MSDKKNSFKTFAPIFNGFYETPFGINVDDAPMELAENLPYSDSVKELLCEFFNENWLDCIDEKYNDFEKDSAVCVCEFLTDKLNEIFNTDIKVKFEKVISPKYYNYANDSIDVEFECDVNEFMKELQQQIKKHFVSFDKYIKEHYTSYDGFMSFYSNNSADWIKKEYDQHEIGALIDFVLKVNYPQIYDELIYYVKENVYDTYYISLTEKVEDILSEKAFDSIFNDWEKALKQKQEYIELVSSQGKQIDFNSLAKNETNFEKQLLEEMKQILKNY